MSPAGHRITHTVAACLALVSCTDYTGDGVLTDNGPSSANDRFVFDFGSIELGRRATYEFDVENLPNEEFVWGLQVLCASEECSDEQRIEAEVEISIRDIDTQEALHYAAPLSKWTWSLKKEDPLAFVYGRSPEPGTYFCPETTQG